MARTALDEQFGGSTAATISSAYQLPVPSGVPGAKRMFHFDSGIGASVVLPDATSFPHCVGGDPCYTLFCTGSLPLDVEDDDGNVLVTMAIDSSAKFYLTDASTAAGSWVIKTTTGISVGASATTGLEEYTVSLQSGVDVNLRELLVQQGYDGIDPVFINASLYASNTSSIAVMGSSSTSEYALSTGSFPAGSSMLLTLGSGVYICGRGGDGGNGTIGVTAATDGSDGGTALRLEIDTTLVSYGSILAGGGGGGGDTTVAATNYAPGPGGGGGAGYEVSAGGSSSNASMSGGAGGLLTSGFAGGTHSSGAFGLGGEGGAHGSAGGSPQYGIAVGGSAGDAIHILTGVTLTKQVAGTITGSEVTV